MGRLSLNFSPVRTDRGFAADEPLLNGNEKPRYHQGPGDDQKQGELKERRKVHHETRNRASVCNHSPMILAR